MANVGYRDGHPLVLPVVNINGTNVRELKELYIAAHSALDAAAVALCQATPHGRDYQTLDRIVYQVARVQHEARVKDVVRARDEIGAIIADLVLQEVK